MSPQSKSGGGGEMQISGISGLQFPVCVAVGVRVGVSVAVRFSLFAKIYFGAAVGVGLYNLTTPPSTLFSIFAWIEEGTLAKKS